MKKIITLTAMAVISNISLIASNIDLPLFPENYQPRSAEIKRKAQTIPAELEIKQSHNRIYRMKGISFLMDDEGYFIEQIDKYGTNYLKGWEIDNNFDVNIDKGPVTIQSDYEDHIRIYKNPKSQKGEIIEFYYKASNRYRRYLVDISNFLISDNKKHQLSWWSLFLYPAKEIIEKGIKELYKR